MNRDLGRPGFWMCVAFGWILGCKEGFCFNGCVDRVLKFGIVAAGSFDSVKDPLEVRLNFCRAFFKIALYGLIDQAIDRLLQNFAK